MREKIVGSAVVAATAGLLAAGYVHYWRRRRVYLPTEWRQIGTLSYIYMSPLKSGFMAEHTEAICDVAGLMGSNKRLRDRSFMMVNAEGKFVTGRTHPLLTQVKCDVNDTEAVMSFVLNEEVRPLTMKFDDLENRKPTKVNFGWHEKRWIKVVDCGDEAAEWITSCVVTPEHKQYSAGIATSLRLVFVVDDTLRDDLGLFCDITSYMLITEKSLNDLNSRLNVPVSMRNFRPSLVVSGTSEPFEEDKWEWVRIGDVVFKYIQPCPRCVFTTVDADTGVKNQSMEPLKTLKTYRQTDDVEMRRKNGDAPIMGAHYGLRSASGVIRKGDPVYVNFE